MPGRRKTSLSRSTSQSRRKQDERAVETEEKREARLATDRARHAAARAQERLSRDREYHAASRADETEEDRAARLSRDREYHAASRADETEEDRAARLSRDREYHAASRADETEEDRAARLSRDREYHAASRADETEEDRAARLSRDREYHAASRADETEEDRAARLSRDREYHAASRADETEEDRAARLSRDREYHAASRADETEEDRAARLSRDREYHAASRADETEEDRAARLSRDREYHAASRAGETEEDRAARLSRDREYQAASRAGETEEDRAARLSRDREYHAASRAGETEEDRAARLSRDREYHAASRADETEEDRAARLSTDRAHHSAARLAESQAERDTRRRSDRIRQAQRRSTLTEEEHSRILEARREDHARRQEQAQRQREERGQALTIFMALTCDVLTLSMMKIKIDNDLRAGTVILYPKMETVGSDYVRPETSAGVKILPLRNGIHSNNGLITTKAVFPEEKYSHDVLASVQREGFLGFPKAEKYEMTMELQTTTEDENHFTTEIFTESPLISMDEIKKALMLTAQELKKKNMAKTNSDPNSLMPAIERSKVNNIESHTTIAGDVYVPNGENSFTTYSEMSSELPIKIADEIQEPHVSDKSSNIIEAVTQQNKLDSERYTLRRTANQKKEDEMQIKNAKYKFSTSQNDGISDLLHERTESRQDGKVTGSYTYSDGFLLRRVKYVADKNGYRIISEESVPLLGNGPKVNPEGTADIKSEIGGHPVHYVIRGKDLPQRTLRYQGKGRI